MNRTRFSTAQGRRITRMLAAACVTQARLARLLGLPRSTLNQMITGRMLCAGDLEARVRHVLGPEDGV